MIAKFSSGAQDKIDNTERPTLRIFACTKSKFVCFSLKIGQHKNAAWKTRKAWLKTSKSVSLEF